MCTTDSKHSLPVAANLPDQNFVADSHRRFVVVDVERATADNADLAHLPADECRVARRAAERREDALSRLHAADVLRAGFAAHKNHAAVGVALAVFIDPSLGLVGMGLTYVLGKMLHAEVNRPPSVAASELRDEAGRQVFDDSRKHLKGLSIADKRLIASGVPDPIDKVRDEKAAAREREVKAVEERRRIAEENNRQNDEFYRKMITPPPDKVTSNGNGHF